MAYTLYLYKEFVSRTNVTLRLEIFERDYSGSAIEIDSLSSTPVQLVTDNMNNDLATNYIKTHLLINIIDTEQIDYTRLFTSDATKFKVVFKINSVVEWTGYLVPDSFYQPLTYRNTIQLTARDNLGMLSEFTYLESGLGTISSIIEDALAKISFACTLEYRIKKIDENGTNIRLGLVNKDYLYGKNYDEVLSILLSGMGCQMRFVGGNKYAIFDLADLSGYGTSVTAQEFIFTGQSGNLELVPAWKNIIVSQDYGLIDPIFQQRPTSEQLVFSAYKNVYTDYYYGGTPVPPYITLPTYTPNGSGWSGTLGVYSPYEFGEDKNTILLPKMTQEQAESNVSLPPYIQFTKEVPAYDGGIKISFQVHNMLMMPDYEAFTLGKLALTDKSPILGADTKGVGIIIAYNVFLDSGGVTYRLSDTWQTYTGQAVANNFIVDKPYKDEDKYQNGSDIGLEINILSLKSGGTLRVQLYGYYIWGTLTDDIYFDRIVRIKDFKFQVITNESGGLESRAINDINYNIRGNINLNLGQVPTGKLGYLSMGGGIYQNSSPYYPPMVGFKRTGEDSVHLSEQIGREVLHLRKQQRTSLNGTIQKSTRGILDFGKPFSYNSKTYALNYGSLDYASEQMQVELIEVEPYEYEDYTFVEAEVESGAGSVGSGEREFIQWSAAGNAKRIYDLDTASEADQGGAFVFIDKSGLTAAKKVPISSLLVDAYTKTESDSRFASIDGDLTQDFSAKKLTTATLLLPQSAPTLSSGEAAIYSLDSGFSGETPSGAGTLTSVALTMPTGFSVSGSPITESGTFGVTFASGYRMFTETEIGNKIESSLIGAANGITPLDSGGKVALQYLPSTLLKYMGVWNASTNSPTLTSPDTNRKGQVWNVSVAGTQFGLDFKLGDWLIYNDSGVAEKSDNSDDVTSVNGYTGAVTLKTSDIAEQTNLYYTDARVKTYADTLYTPIAHGQITSGNPHGTTAAQVGALALTGGVLSGVITTLGGFDGTFLESIRFANTGYPNSYTNAIFSTQSLAASGSFLEFRLSNGETTRNVALKLGNLLSTFSGAVTLTKLTSTTLLLPQVAPTLASGEMAIYGLESGFSGEIPSGAGSVTSISMVVPTGLSVTPETITESGTFTISYASGYSIPTNTKQGEWDNAYALRHNAVTLGTANGLSLSTQELSLGLASASANGALSSTDWNTFNGKQAKLIGTGASSLVRVSTSGVIDYDNNSYATVSQLSGYATTSSLSNYLGKYETYAMNKYVLESIPRNTTQVGNFGWTDYQTTPYAGGGFLTLYTGSSLRSLLMIFPDYANNDNIKVLTSIDGAPWGQQKEIAWKDHNHDSIYLGVTAKANDSDKLDGHDTAYFQTALTNPVTGTGTSGYLPKFTGASTIGDSPIYTDGTKIGVGTATPQSLIESVGTSDNQMSIYRTQNGAGYGVGLFFALNNSSNTRVVYAELSGAISSNTASSESGKIYFLIRNSGTLEIKATLDNLGLFSTTENNFTNLRIPKVAPTSPTSGQYYFYIVE